MEQESGPLDTLKSPSASHLSVDMLIGTGAGPATIAVTPNEANFASLSNASWMGMNYDHPELPGSGGQLLPSDLLSHASLARLPSYIKPLPVRFEEDDISYLRSKGALSIPQPALLLGLLQSYADYTHPYMPTLDLAQLIRSVNQVDGFQRVSLLLFQAVMFAGVAHVEAGLLTNSGFTSRREARRILFNRTRLLYDLDYEDDETVLIQALLLMTYWREEKTGRKETHHWTDIVLSLAQKMGLHLEVPELSDSATQILRRRIWWSIYLRDVQISLNKATPTRISEIDFDVPLLQLSDLGPGAFPVTLLDTEAVQDVGSARELSILFLEMVKLALCTSQLLAEQHGSARSKGSLKGATILEAWYPSWHALIPTQKLLLAWEKSLPSEARYVALSSVTIKPTNTPVILHRTYLHMTYHAVTAAMYRCNTTILEGSAGQDTSLPAMTEAAAAITSLAEDLRRLDIVRYLPSPSITILLPAIVTHLSNTLAPSSLLDGEAMSNFCKCMQVLASLREIYAAADYATASLQTALQHASTAPRTTKVEASSLAEDERESHRLLNPLDTPQHFASQTSPLSSDGGIRGERSNGLHVTGRTSIPSALYSAALPGTVDTPRYDNLFDTNWMFNTSPGGL